MPPRDLAWQIDLPRGHLGQQDRGHKQVVSEHVLVVLQGFAYSLCYVQFCTRIVFSGVHLQFRVKICRKQEVNVKYLLINLSESEIWNNEQRTARNFWNCAHSSDSFGI